MRQISVFGRGFYRLAVWPVLAGVIVLAMAVVVIIDVAFIWLPFGFYLAAPNATTRYVTATDAWVQTHSRTIIIAVLLVVGLILVVNGATGLA